MRETEEVLGSYEQRKAELSRRAAGDVLAELAAKGIRGSALQPKAAADPDYTGRMEELGREYGARLAEKKRVMLGT
ncbi:MAG: hypothetical protein AB1896_14085 [Thermodesulfobacteriota bacterium]